MPTLLLLDGPPTSDAPEPWRVAPAGERAPRPGRAGTRILVADDDPVVRTMVERLLLEEGYDVVTAAHGEEALRVASSEGPVDLLVTDIRMPVMDGWELSRRLLQRWPSLPVLYISAYDLELTRGAPAGRAGRFLRKPFDLASLSQLVASLLDSE